MRFRGVVLALVVLLPAGGLLGACSNHAVAHPAYAAFRYVTDSGSPIPVAGQDVAKAAQRGVRIAANHTQLPGGRQAIQELWVFDPIELPPARYQLSATPEGWVVITGGSFSGYVVPPPALN